MNAAAWILFLPMFTAMPRNLMGQAELTPVKLRVSGTWRHRVERK